MAIVSALTERAFAGRRQRDWETLDALVRAVQTRGLRVLLPEQIAQLSPLYRDVCADLSRAEGARYSAPLIDYLQGLAAATHAVLYGHPRGRWSIAGGRGSTVRTFVEAFPRAVRRHRVAMLLAFLLFFVPFFGGFFATMLDPGFALRIVPEAQLRPLVEAYKQGFSSARGAGLDAAMAGFYVNNNVGIALRCFATGLFFGLGSAFYLVQNGLATGAVMGYVASHGAGDNILTFVVGHGSLELGAIVLAGGAGLALGWSIVSPGDKTRIASLQTTAKSVVVVVFGAAVMLFMAAAVEGFWSASTLPSVVKRSVGGAMFVIVTAYILLAGRGSEDAAEAERTEGDRPMDLMRARVALRERPLLDTFDLAVRFCAAHAWAYTKLSLVVLVPAFAVSFGAARLGGWWLGWSVTVVVTAFAGSPFVALASRLVFADAVGTREALGIALRAVPRLIGVRLIQAMAVGASLVLLGLPWFWLGTILLFVVEILVLEQGTVGSTLGRAQRVASAHFSDALLTMLLLGAAPVAAAMLADVAGREILQGLLEFKPPPSMFRAGGSWLALLGWWATVPLLQTARFFVYLDIRTRTEGWDIQTRFAAIAARSEAERAEAAGLGAEKAARRRAGAAVVGMMTLLALLAVARPAHAVLDPAHAQADVDAAIHDGDYTFCRAPRTPLSHDARQLCPHASEIPGCAGFLAECTKATTPPPPPPSSSSWSWPWGKSPISIPAFVGTGLEVLIWLFVAALVVAILVPIIRAIVRIRRSKGTGEKEKNEKTGGVRAQEEPISVLPMMTDEEILLARGDELARAGHYGAALQHYLAASLRALDKRGAVRITRDRTNGEYVRGCGDASAKPALRDIVREVDRVQFGGESPTPDGVMRAAQRAVAIVRAVPVMLLALALMLSMGCGGGAGGSSTVPHAGDDPAGREVFHDVLERQGVNVAPLETSLASLPLPKAGERAPAVVVDLERTSLDDDTRDHLVEWVDEGGVLVLVGSPYAWPKAFGVASAVATSPYKLTVRRLLARSPPAESDDDEDQAEEGTIYAHTTERGVLSEGTALGFSGTTERVATFDDGQTYAAVLPHGKGFLLGIATNELLQNAALARPGNAAAMVSILSNADRLEMRLADPEDGVSPPSTPIGALLRAGLGLGLGHALLATLALFFAVGLRLARPKPAPPPRRRAFAEHVEAVGALYARTRNAPHALAAYARFADDRLRARMPRGTGDVAAFLASRASMPIDVCQRLWARAVQAKAGAPPLGDELTVLRELSAVYAAAMAQGDVPGQR